MNYVPQRVQTNSEIQAEQRLVMFVCALIAVAYPVWRYLLQWLNPNLYDPVLPRIAISLFAVACGVTTAAAKLPRMVSSGLFTALACTMMVHGAWLLHYSAFNEYHLVAIVILLNLGVCFFSTMRQVLSFLGVAAVSFVYLAHLSQYTGRSVYFLMISLTSAMAVFPMFLLRLRVSQKVSSTKQTLESLFNSIPDAIILTDRDGRLLRWNQPASRMLGAKAIIDSGSSLAGLVSTEDRASLLESIQLLSSGQSDGICSEYSLHFEDGHANLIRMHLYRIADQDDNLIAIMHDITTTRETELLLEAQYTIYEAIVARKPNDELLQLMCRQICRLIPGTASIISMVKRDRNVVLEGARAEVPADLQLPHERPPKSSEAGAAGVAVAKKRMIWSTAEGESPGGPENLMQNYRDVGYQACWAFPVMGRTGEVIGVIEVLKKLPERPSPRERRIVQAFGHICGQIIEQSISDELVEFQRIQVTQAARMASLGEMAAGIAHEINNPMTVIQGRSEQIRLLLAHQPVDLEKITSACANIERMVQRVAKIIQGLRSFSRMTEKEMMVDARISEIIEEATGFCLQRFRNESINLIVEPFDQQISLKCRPTQLSQVLLNLLNNAHDAITGLPEKWVKISIRNLGTHLRIAVTDSGTGIPDDVAAKLFQPFFTTKEIGKGTGLGLSISHGIIQDHNGSFTLDRSSPNTSFVIDIPKTQPESFKKSA